MKSYNALLTLTIITLFLTVSQLISTGRPEKELKVKLRKSVVSVVTESEIGGGTGFLVKNDAGRAFIITNRHVCKGTMQLDGSVKIKTAEETIKRKVIEISDKSDLCIIEAGPHQEPLEMARDYSLDDDAYVMGHPHLQPLTFVHGELVADVTIGMLHHYITPNEPDCSGPGLHAEKIDMVFFQINVCIEDYKSILTTARIFPGNSGSPVVDNRGKVIGVIFTGNNSTNYGYAVPLDQLRTFINKY